MRLAIVAACVLAGAVGGCIPTQSQDTPVEAMRQTEPRTGAKYWLYKPSYYRADRPWPLVVTLHGTHGWDPADWQIAEWRKLAEDKGLIVIAPELSSVQGILPVVRSLWYDDLRRDEEAILACIDEACSTLSVDRSAVLLTGFSAGGYPLYYVGLRHPTRFSMLIARSCNCDADMLRSIPVTDDVRRLPVMIFCGKDEPGLLGSSPISRDSWDAFRYLREQKCTKVQHTELPGGHLRRPEMAWTIWAKQLPEQYRDGQR
jgi:poly(3-hydroxybutyrate) depolymerase